MRVQLLFITFILLMVAFIFNENETYASLEDYNIEYNNLTIDEIKFNAINDVTSLNTLGQGYSTSNEIAYSAQGDKISYDKTSYITVDKISNLKNLYEEDTELFAIYSITEFSNFRGGETWDSTNGIRAFSTIYVERTYETNPNAEYIRLLSSEGGWQVLDTSLNTSNPIVTQGVSGMGRDELFVSRSIDYYPYNISSYYYTAPQWPRVNASGVSIWEMNVGESSQINVYRASPSNSWTLYHSVRW